MQGFFSKSETKSLKKTGGGSCYSCKLFKNCKTPKMDPRGGFKKRIMIIGEFPDLKDDNRGRFWSGDSGQLLRSVLKENGVDVDEDCISLNAVNCYPGMKEPTGAQISACRDVKVMKAILEYKPRLIILLGSMAVTSVIGSRWHKSLGNITKWRGWQIPDQELKTFICPTFHPAYIKKFDSPEMELIFRKDITDAIYTGLNTFTFPEYEKPNIKFIDARDLESIDFNGKTVAFDYEATGIKPQAKGHRIICAAIALSSKEVLVFPMPTKHSQRKAFVRFLQNKKCKKIAQNLKYEDHWSAVRLRAEVEGWFNDPMIMSHILDHRAGITGLKFQVYVRLGLIDYSSHIDPYLKSESGKTNTLNKLIEKREDPQFMRQLMEYCAIDAASTFALYQLQQQELIERSLPF